MQESLSPAEKRKLFKQRYGDLLIPHGFFFKGRNYYRLNMQEQIVLVVSIHYGQSGHMCSLRIAALPFALGLNADCFYEGNIFIDGDVLLNRGKDTIRIYPFEEKFEAAYNEFVKTYLERFLSVHGLPGWDDFETWANGGPFRPDHIGRAWPCIILGRFDQAAFYVNNCIISDMQRLEEYRKSLRRAEEDADKFEKENHAGLHPSSIAATRRRLAFYVQLYRDDVKRTAETVEKNRQFLEKIVPPQAEYFANQIQSAINQSIETCKTYFGKHADQ